MSENQTIQQMVIAFKLGIKEDVFCLIQVAFCGRRDESQFQCEAGLQSGEDLEDEGTILHLSTKREESFLSLKSTEISLFLAFCRCLIKQAKIKKKNEGLELQTR